MKCACGNELGKPRVKPYPVFIKGLKKDENVDLLYMGGFAVQPDGTFKCWFCAFPR